MAYFLFNKYLPLISLPLSPAYVGSSDGQIRQIALDVVTNGCYMDYKDTRRYGTPPQLDLMMD